MTDSFLEALLEMETIWNWMNDRHCVLLILKAYKDALCYANIVDQPPVAEYELEDEPGSSLEGLEAYRLNLVAGERVQETDSHASDNNNSVIEEYFYFMFHFYMREGINKSIIVQFKFFS